MPAETSTQVPQSGGRGLSGPASALNSSPVAELVLSCLQARIAMHCAVEHSFAILQWKRYLKGAQVLLWSFSLLADSYKEIFGYVATRIIGVLHIRCVCT